MKYLSTIPLIVFLDLISKIIVNKNISLNEKKEIIKNKIYLYNLKNKGIAMGFMKNKKNLIIKINVLFLVVIILNFIKIFRNSSNLLKLAFSFIIGGAFGNIIDRIKNNSVTDFIYIKIKKLPVFNIADLFIFLSIMLFLVEYVKNIDIFNFFKIRV